MCLACNLSSTIIVVVYFKLLVVFLILPTTFKHLLMLSTMKEKSYYLFGLGEALC